MAKTSALYGKYCNSESKTDYMYIYGSTGEVLQQYILLKATK